MLDVTSEREIIFESQHVTVVNAEQNSPTVFVTFNEVERLTDGVYFWGAATFERLGISAIGFVSSSKNWYPPPDMASAIEVARARIGGRRVVTFGFSQGGYGALKFGAQLSASLALGFSPQWSINPDDVAQFDQRFLQFFDHSLRGGERIEAHDLCSTNFVFADPDFANDMMNVRHILPLGNVVLIPVPFVRHGTVRVITEGGLGRRLIERCLEDRNVTAADLRNLVRAGRAQSAMYLRGRITRLFQTGGRHRGFLEATLRGIPDGPEKTIFLAVGHDAAKQSVEARAALASIDDEDLLNLDLRRYWGIFRASGFAEGEKRLARLLNKINAGEPPIDLAP